MGLYQGVAGSFVEGNGFLHATHARLRTLQGPLRHATRPCMGSSMGSTGWKRDIYHAMRGEPRLGHLLSHLYPHLSFAFVYCRLLSFVFRSHVLI